MSDPADKASEDHEKVLEQVASALSHDVRTPIRHVGHFLDFFIRELDQPLSPMAEEHLKLLRDSLDNAGAMVETLINFARLDHPRPEWSRLCLQTLATEALGRSRMSLKADNVGMSLHGAGFVDGAKGLLLSLFSHLFDNAIMFCPDDVQLEIRVTITERPDGFYEIIVEDNGKGITGSEAAVFRLFQNGTRGRPFQGDGCGLPFARRIAEIHGGSLSLMKEPHLLSGAAFKLELPVSSSES